MSCLSCASVTLWLISSILSQATTALVHSGEHAYGVLEGFVSLFEVVDVAVFEERERAEDDADADGHLDGQAQEEDVYLRRDAVDDAEEEVSQQQSDHRGRGQMDADRDDAARHARDELRALRPARFEVREFERGHDFETSQQ